MTHQIRSDVTRACDPSVELLISEFMALNTKTLVDEDEDYPDWIEIYNPCVSDVDLDGWYLTDDPGNLTKWRFPSVHLSRGEFPLSSRRERTGPRSAPRSTPSSSWPSKANTWRA